MSACTQTVQSPMRAALGPSGGAELRSCDFAGGTDFKAAWPRPREAPLAFERKTGRFNGEMGAGWSQTVEPERQKTNMLLFQA